MQLQSAASGAGREREREEGQEQLQLLLCIWICLSWRWAAFRCNNVATPMLILSVVYFEVGATCTYKSLKIQHIANTTCCHSAGNIVVIYA